MFSRGANIVSIVPLDYSLNLFIYFLTITSIYMMDLQSHFHNVIRGPLELRKVKWVVSSATNVNSISSVFTRMGRG